MGRKRSPGPVRLSPPQPREIRKIRDTARFEAFLSKRPAKHQTRLYACAHPCQPGSPDYWQAGDIDCPACAKFMADYRAPATLEIPIVDTGRVMRFTIPRQPRRRRR